MKSTVELDINKLGIRKQNLEKLLSKIKKPNGIILNTGPTGSGKTTTLYSLLYHFKQAGSKNNHRGRSD